MSARRWSTLSLLALVSASCTSGSRDTADGARHEACDVSVQPRAQAETPVRASTALVATMRARFHRTGASPLGIPFASAPLSPGEAPIVFDGGLQAPLDVARQTSPVDTQLVDTKLPGLADRPLAIRDRLSGIGLEASLFGAREVSAEIEDGLLVYRRALGEADLVRRVLADGVEDFVHLPTRPTDASIRWSISLSGPVKGLRLVGGIVEMLDERGTPRLRIGRPYVYGADGTRVDATSAIEGCSFDTSAAAPWGRPIVSPGSDHCTLRVSWLADSVRYPALVDPTFTATGSSVVGPCPGGPFR